MFTNLLEELPVFILRIHDGGNVLPPEHCYLSTKLHGATLRKTAILNG
jgi:hypothetical protein